MVNCLNIQQEIMGSTTYLYWYDIFVMLFMRYLMSLVGKNLFVYFEFDVIINISRTCFRKLYVTPKQCYQPRWDMAEFLVWHIYKSLAHML
jgi:hypothetical protein